MRHEKASVTDSIILGSKNLSFFSKLVIDDDRPELKDIRLQEDVKVKAFRKSTSLLEADLRKGGQETIL